MKRNGIVALFATLAILGAGTSCQNGEQKVKKDTLNIKTEEIYGKIEINDNTYLISSNHTDSSLVSISVEKNEIDTLSRIQTFLLRCESTDKKNYRIVGIEKRNEEIKRKMLVATEEEIDDFKRRRNGSYAIIELKNGEMIVVSTPKEDISRMLRLNSFNFYYYKNWDGKYYFDHIEKQ